MNGLDQTDDGRAVVRRGMTAVQTDGAVVYNSHAIRAILDQVHMVAPTNATVLLLGETGVGKDVFARAIHNASPRRHLPMVCVNCAAIPATLIERELFGHERGAFTGAVGRQVGWFEAANGSTLFLDEIGELPIETQVKLLRVLEDRTIERLGNPLPIKVDIRIIAASNRDLEQAVKRNIFREDLLYRLNVFPMTIPPLRERTEDIPALTWKFIDELSPRCGKQIDAISSLGLAELQRYSWPGNVRELRNLIEREIILAQDTTLKPAAPRSRLGAPCAASERLADIHFEHIQSVLQSCGWRIRGAGGAAARLGLKPTTLEARMARLGIVRDREASTEPLAISRAAH